MIKINNLSVSYARKLPDVISGMSFELEKGCILNILGQNAVGKTTLIRTLMREIRGYRGSIQINGESIEGFSIPEYAKIIGVVSTSYNTFQNLLVADYLVTGFVSRMTYLSKPDDEKYQKAYDILCGFDKQDLFNKQINQLSSGERQMIMIARVLLQNPEIVIVDEPTANLDVKNQIAVLNQLKVLSQNGYTVIVTTHNPGHAYSLGGKTLLMGKGKYCFGSTEEVITERNLSEYYELQVSIDENNHMVFGISDDENGVRLVL